MVSCGKGGFTPAARACPGTESAMEKVPGGLRNLFMAVFHTMPSVRRNKKNGGALIQQPEAGK